jgi:GT2 family glycosyltransferase
MEEKKIDLSIIILSYNSKTDLERLLPSIEASEGVDFVGNGFKPFQQDALEIRPYTAEIIVVDNGSTDGTPEWLETVFRGREKLFLVKNQNNGFAHGNNLGIRQAKGKYLLILNPDTRLEKDTLKTMLEFMEANPQVGISTCKVLLPNGELDLACRRRFPNPWNSFKRLFLRNNTDYNFMDVDENKSIEIDSCMGAFMMARRELKVIKLSSYQGGTSGNQNPQPSTPTPFFDESFFMYGEDLDLCWRVKEVGYKVWYHPATFITHFKGSTSRKTPFKALKWFHEAMWIFYKKHYATKYPFFLNWLVWLGIYFRLIMLIIINSLKKEPKVSG